MSTARKRVAVVGVGTMGSQAAWRLDKENYLASRRRVAVVGTGTVGSEAAWRLEARGAEVLACDRFAPGHDRSATGGETRVFRSVQTHDGRYVPLVRHADVLWKQYQAETGRELRRLIGALVMGPADDHKIHTVMDGIAEHGLDHEVSTPTR
ncbi:FAD-dependent oxidoreductase [Streptomyces scabiei]|uniref:FAD-dependent oxidoreductase n=1 Tax=Streptomyces scabiei TaxID=1930 RepID=UPI00299060D7|nr:FAD-dependent oxidoreductase [Streptomyces scabiei]MDW8804732.1 FAD-dependent oxidoreductase [Streptomyces scabiei]